MKRSTSTLLFMLACAQAVGCVPANSYQDPVSKFNTGVTITAAAVRPYFTELNRIEAESAMYEALRSNGPFGSNQLQPKFSKEAIQVRLQAIQLVTQYANLLGGIANSKAPEELAANAKALGDNVAALTTRMNALGGQNLPNLGTPLASLTNAFGQIVIENRRREALERNILSGAVPITQILTLLRDDLTSSLAARSTAAQNVKNVRITLYNTTLGNASPTDKFAMVDDILAQTDKIDELDLLDAPGLLKNMQEAHEALVRFAEKAKKSPADMADLANRINAFTERATLVVTAVNDIRALKK